MKFQLIFIVYVKATQEEALAMKQTNEEQKKEIEKLKDHLTDVNIELFESKLLQKKYQSAIKVLSHLLFAWIYDQPLS